MYDEMITAEQGSAALQGSNHTSMKASSFSPSIPLCSSSHPPPPPPWLLLFMSVLVASLLPLQHAKLRQLILKANAPAPAIVH